MEKLKQITCPWEMMYEPYEGIYTKDEIDEMTFEELFELMDKLDNEKETK